MRKLFNNNCSVYRMGLGTVELICHSQAVADKDHYASPNSPWTQDCNTCQPERPHQEIRSGNIVEYELGQQKLRFDSFPDDCSFQMENRCRWKSVLSSKYLLYFIVRLRWEWDYILVPVPQLTKRKDPRNTSYYTKPYTYCRMNIQISFRGFIYQSKIIYAHYYWACIPTASVFRSQLRKIKLITI